VDCERTRDYRSRISCLNLTSLFALFVFLVCRLTSGAFTINSSSPTLRRNLNEHPIYKYGEVKKNIEKIKIQGVAKLTYSKSAVL
jgi:hypothetical protein